jgi:hypothetical protein
MCPENRSESQYEAPRSRSCGRGWLLGNRQKMSSFGFLLGSSIILSFSISHPRQQRSSTVKMANSNLVYSILWLIVLWFISWPIAGFAAGFWILIQVRSTVELVCLTFYNNAPCRPKVPRDYFCHSQSCSVLSF